MKPLDQGRRRCLEKALLDKDRRRSRRMGTAMHYRFTIKYATRIGERGKFRNPFVMLRRTARWLPVHGIGLSGLLWRERSKGVGLAKRSGGGRRPEGCKSSPFRQYEETNRTRVDLGGM